LLNNERSIFGYGPGETYLGAATSVEPGEDLTATLTVNGDFTGKALSATTTAIDATTDSGFGSTSEYLLKTSVSAPKLTLTPMASLTPWRTAAQQWRW
jgi:hypothetical protein